MRHTLVLGLIARAVSGCTERYQPQRTAVSTPTAEWLKFNREQARRRDQAIAAYAGGATILGVRPSGAPRLGPDDLHRHGDRFRNLGRTDASIVALDPSRPAQVDASPPATVPLVLKLPPGME
ncbi:hypothetical protein ACU5AX_05030 [Sphingomonas sp. XXL09]|uniref:hypothetical protein n=1 Tax=Sphingomonas sp. XXL09 TaxID=3457787 RepID=UPI00406BD800